jgi:hypothetical protein
VLVLVPRGMCSTPTMTEHQEVMAGALWGGWNASLGTGLSGFAIAVVVWPSSCGSSMGGDSLVLLGPLHSEERVHDCSLLLWVTNGLLVRILLSPCPCPGGGAQAVGPGQWVQTWWGYGK